MDDNTRLFLACALSIAVLIGWGYIFEPAQAPFVNQALDKSSEETETIANSLEGEALLTANPGQGDRRIKTIPKGKIGGNDGPRLAIKTDQLQGSINLQGASLDDVILRQYRQTLADDSPYVRLLQHQPNQQPYYLRHGWISDSKDLKLPDNGTLWQTDKMSLGADGSVTLFWENGQGLRFEKTISLDDQFLFTVEQKVINSSQQDITIYPYGLVFRASPPSGSGFFISHEGPVGYLNQSLEEYSYQEIEENGVVQATTTGGWLGFTDKYWLATLIPDQGQEWTTRFLYRQADGQGSYQADYIGIPTVVEVGTSYQQTSYAFVGAKVVSILDRYSNSTVEHLDLAVDFGWFYFLTKPIFYLLDGLHQFLGNFGLAIIVLTVFMRLMLYPLAAKSFTAMHKMRQLQPKIVALRERHSDDRAKLNQELMEIYKEHKINPAAGCLPIFLQIPIFFCLYKVLFVTIEMRQAPFYGWIYDLSARDPSNLFMLFGAIDWSAPSWLHLGVWPMLMGISMWLQQKLNPAPTDPIQAKIFMVLPVLFTILLASFPAGLVIYWTWNNMLSIIQQKWQFVRLERHQKGD